MEVFLLECVADLLHVIFRAIDQCLPGGLLQNIRINFKKPLDNIKNNSYNIVKDPNNFLPILYTELSMLSRGN